MRLSSIAVSALVLLSSASWAAPPRVPLCEPWGEEYQGQAATGQETIALWQFNVGAELEDASGHGHKLALVGAKARTGGRFGGGLETFCGWPVEDKPHRALAKNHPALSPKGPFTIDLWICPKPELKADYPMAFLLDKKYVAHSDYQLLLDQIDKSGRWTLQANLGFGASSDSWYSKPIEFRSGTWYHLAFTYDGEGTGNFYLDGVPWGGRQVAGRKAVAPGDHPLSIGDRIGSYYHGFPGLVDQVRISDGVLEFRKVRIERVSDRANFVRMEPDARLRFAVTNLERGPLASAKVRMSLGELGVQEMAITNLGAGESTTIEYPLDTRLRPGQYVLEAKVVVTAPKAYATEESLPVRLVARRPAKQFPVLMWGVYGDATKEAQRLKEIGFTHVLGLGADEKRIWEAGKPTEPASPESVAETKRSLDEALASDLTLVASLSPGSELRHQERLLRINREGKPVSREDICGLFPDIQKYCYNVGVSVGQAYSRFPAFGAALIHTEVRDGANCCFHSHDLEAFRKFAGFEVPKEASARWGVSYASLPGAPPSRVIPDNHPVLLYYRWYWKQGDGWNELNSQVARGLRTAMGKDFWTFHDPAVRVASVYGSGGEVDTISQWTYSYPDPIRIATATDELLAMAGGRSGQNVMKMTQIIWYRSQTAPEPKKGAETLPYQAEWERQQPDAPFITIAPMHLREAFWTKIARPIKGIMYHGWQSLVPCESVSGYRYTHPQTQHELGRLVREVVRPLGPMLLEVPGVKGDVAFLESFASQMFAQRGTYGWGGGWGGDAYLVSLWAHLQPDIVYDETIVQRGLDGYRVLVMADCDVITEKMLERIKAFQAGGGIVVGDDHLTPAIKPDIVLVPYKRTGHAREDKAALVALAGQLRKSLDSRYRRYADSSSPDVIPYRRQYKDSDYLFVVNDRREYGDYVGQHGLVMENGLPSRATLSIGRPAGFVYDLVGHTPMVARQESGRMALDISLGPCDGRCYLVTGRAIENVRIQVPDSIERGQSARCLVEVVDAQGKPIDAVVPVEVTIRDATTAVAEFSGFHAATGGRLEIPLDVATNDPAGSWTIEVRELASGRQAAAYFHVPGPSPWPPGGKPLPKGAANPVQPKG